jgi:ATP-binding cassette, subfamily B, multidrug efflux pump
MKNLAYLNKYFWKYRGRLFMGFILIAAGNIFSVYAPAVVRDGIDFLTDTLSFSNSGMDSAQIAQPKSFVTLLSWIGIEAESITLNQNNFAGIAIRIGIWLAVLYIVMFLIKGVFLFYQRQALIVMSRYIEYDLKNEIYNKYQQLDLTFYKKNRTGDLMNRISEDVNRVRMYIGPAVMYTINLVVLLVMCIVVMLQIDAELTLYTLSPLPFMMIAIFYVSRMINKKSEQVQQQQSTLSSMVQETTAGIRVLKAFSRESYFEKAFAESSSSYKSKQLELVKIDALFMPVIILLVGLSTILTVYVGAHKVMAGEISAGVIVQFVFYVNILTWPFAIVGWVTSLVQKAEASQQRINEFLNTQPEIRNEQANETMPRGDFEFRDVSYSYTESGITALKHISFKIPEGKTLGIIGRTGSGKSTLANLIPRMLDPTTGQISLGGVELKNINLNTLRNQIGYVTQDVFLFSESITNNIAFGIENPSQALIEQAAKDAAIHDNIMSFPAQYDTLLGERGINLSGGQKQRISIARAIIKNPQILIFDDCLSAVDTETEEKILGSLQRIMKGKTSIVISHRISSVKSADQILVLEHGAIAEQGNHEELLMKNGKYAAIYKRQMMEEGNA